MDVGSSALFGVWECFRDPCYYDMWAVRRTHERGWGQCFHMNNEEEAKALAAMLNSAIEAVAGTYDDATRGLDAAHAILASPNVQR